MRGFWKRLGAFRVPVAIGTLGAIGLAFVPLFGVHGVESALALGLVLPLPVCFAANRFAFLGRRRGEPFPFARALEVALKGAALCWTVPVAVLLLNAARVRQCAAWEGLAYMVLGPGMGVTLAALVGIAWAGAVHRPRISGALAVGTPLAAMSLSVYRLWASPAVFAFDHFAGYFPGALYDENTGLPMEFVTFRMTTLAWAAAVTLLGAGLWRSGGAHVAEAAMRARLVRCAMGLGALAAGVAADAWGAELGHRSRADYMAQVLGRELMGTRCIVDAPRELTYAERRRLVTDCDFRVIQAERRLGVRQRRPIRAFFLRNGEEKRRLMGARATYIAKPWRDEVYLQVDAWPHPVLAHEIAHVVAGNVAPGLLRVPGRFGGWLPNPALIEGMAVAIAWDTRDGLTPDEGARALLEIGRLPAMRNLFGVAFYGEAPAPAYAAAGSFLHFVALHYGAAALRSAYATNDLPRAVGRPLDALDREWRVYLRTIPLSEAALAVARARFATRSIFARVCPRVVARLKDVLAQDLSAGDTLQACSSAEAILAIDEEQPAVRAAYVGALVRAGNAAAAETQLHALRSDASVPAPLLAAAIEAIADAAWIRGDRTRAQTLYLELDQLPQTEDRLRALDVKRIGIAAEGPERELLRSIFVGPNGVAAPAPLIVELANRLQALVPNGIGAYLSARQLFGAAQYAQAAQLMREASTRGLPSARLVREAERVEAIAMFADGDCRGSEQLWQGLRAAADAPAALQNEAEDWLERLRTPAATGGCNLP